MSSCAAVDTVCQLLAGVGEVVDIKTLFVLTITAYVSWLAGYEKGRASMGCRKEYCEGFVNGIMYIMVKFKAQTNVSFNLIFERDRFATEAIHRIGQGVGYKEPTGDKVC
jgi:hypothetical protein